MKQFHIADPGEFPHGPYDEPMVRRAFEHGMYPEGTMVWREEADDWEHIENIFGPHIATRTNLPPPSQQYIVSANTSIQHIVLPKQIIHV